jgi:hypothetical protein
MGTNIKSIFSDMLETLKKRCSIFKPINNYFKV